jgi:hypothetical protein
MEKVFAPIIVKLLLIANLAASIAERIPTRAAIPIDIIKAVRTVRSIWLRIARRDILMFSFKNDAIFTGNYDAKVLKNSKENFNYDSYYYPFGKDENTSPASPYGNTIKSDKNHRINYTYILSTPCNLLVFKSIM